MKFFGYFFKNFFPKKIVGVDVGTASIKMVEISKWRGQKTLENYGQIQLESLYKDSLPDIQKRNNLFPTETISKAIRGILDEAKIKTKEVIFAIPDFVTFCTSFDIPIMTEKEIPDAIRFNASQYITLPISEVTLDWRIIRGEMNNKGHLLKVFLVAVPNQIIQEYQSIAKMAGLKLVALEAEALGITRAIASSNKKVICVVDIGLQSSTINIIDGLFLKKSYSFNFNSGQISKVVSSTLGINLNEAEEIKTQEGLMYPRQELVKTMYLLIDPLLVEVKSVSAEFLQTEKKPVEEIYLTGGTANLPGLKEYVAESLKKNVQVPNCFSDFFYPPILGETLREMAPSFSAAVGVALGGIQT